MRSYEYKPIRAKINHTWWHLFFTSIYSYSNDGRWERYFCSKCNKIYHFDAEKTEVFVCVNNEKDVSDE